ncbi:MAG: glycosyltransferase family 4 protein [Phycisphaerales bacterium]|nr:MAG: glycosyltransferase family 4 protein [Phycisphaerales bacterium]
MARRLPTVCFLIGGREGGGSAYSTQQLIERINRRKFNVTVVSCETGSFVEGLERGGQSCDVLGTGWPPMLRTSDAADTSPRWTGYGQMPGWLLRSARALAAYARSRRIDIVHTNYHHFHLLAAVASALSGRKCVWHWRGPIRHGDLGPPGGLQQNGVSPRVDARWAVLRRASWPLRRLISRFTWSIANSQATARSIQPFTGERVSVIYNGIPLAPPAPPCARLRDSLGLPRQSRIVGLVGSLHPLKGQIYFLEAAAQICPRHQDVHFVCIGGQTAAGQQAYEDSLRARRSAHGLESRVHFMGRQPEAARLMADFDVATVCTLPPGEGFGLVIIEAMAQSVPVIATNVGATVEIIEDGVNGMLVVPADSKALAQAIESLLSDTGQRQTLGAAGLKTCRTRFDIDQTVRQVEDVYARLLAR